MSSYRIYVHSGKEGNGSDTDVSVTIVGDKDFLKSSLNRDNVVDSKGRLFRPGSENVFEVKHEGSLGNQIDFIQVNHNVAYGLFVRWYVESISIEDVAAKKMYVFPCNNWFSETDGDCRQSRLLVNRRILDETLYSDRESGVSLLQYARSVPETRKQSEEVFRMTQSLTSSKEAEKWFQEHSYLILPFENWAGNITKNEVYFYVPSTLTDVKQIIKTARLANMKVRAIGSTHSWTELYPNEKTALIDPQHLKPEEGEEPIAYNEGAKEVTVLCNVTTFRMKVHQLKNNYNFMFNVVLGGVTYGGIISTGCHGTGKYCRTHPDLVKEINIVNSDGKLVTYKRSEDDEMVNAAGLSMGLFGFVYSATLEVVPGLKIVEVFNKHDYKVGDTLLNASALKSVIESNFSTEVFWFPFNSNPCSAGSPVMRAEREKFAMSVLGQLATGATCLDISTNGEWNPNDDHLSIKEVRMDPGGEPVGDLYYDVQYAVQYAQAKLFKEMPTVIAQMPWLTPIFTTFVNFSQKSCKVPGTDIQMGVPSHIVQQLPNAIHYRYWVSEGFQVYNFEMGFIVNDDYENIVQANQAVVDTVKEYAANHKFPMSIGMESRFMSDSQSWLCPAGVGRSKPKDDPIKVAFIGILALGSELTRQLWVQFAQDVAKKWMSVDGVKPLPHWGKASELGCTPQFVKYLWDNNGENMQKFLDQLAKSGADPDKIFFNEYLETVLKKP
ncbi:uncharacterized protein [Oscarella lobularis]|uniref:uncharacterized protein n=1 Tax=Oscarella lobularis TaxID=121494 RepID=UPI00331394C0